MHTYSLEIDGLREVVHPQHAQIENSFYVALSMAAIYSFERTMPIMVFEDGKPLRRVIVQRPEGEL